MYIMYDDPFFFKKHVSCMFFFAINHEIYQFTSNSMAQCHDTHPKDLARVWADDLRPHPPGCRFIVNFYSLKSAITVDTSLYLCGHLKSISIGVEL